MTVVLGGALPASAGAAPLSGTGAGHHVGDAVPTGASIRSLRSSVDPVTGAWTAAVTFAAPQTAGNASTLHVSYSPVGRESPFGWATDTDPDRLGRPSDRPDLLETTYVGSPASPYTTAFDATRTVLTLTVTDQGIAGAAPDVVQASTEDRLDGRPFDVARVFLGPIAPRPLLPAGARRLAVGRDGTVRIPLRALPSAASRRVSLLVGGTRIGRATVPAGASGRREAVVRLTPRSVRRLRRADGRATLRVRTALGNGSTAGTDLRVRIRSR